MPDPLVLATEFVAKDIDKFIKNVGAAAAAVRSFAAAAKGAGDKIGLESMGSEISHLGLLMGKATGNTQQFQDALAKLGPQYGKSEVALNKLYGELSTIEKAISTTSARMKTNGQDGDAWARSLDYSRIHSDMLNKQLKVSNDGFVQTAKTTKETAGYLQNQFVPAVNKASAATAGHTKTQYAHGAALGKVESAFERIKIAMRATAAYGIAAGAIYKVVDAFVAGIKEIATFDQALRNLDAIMGDVTNAQLSIMGDKMLEVAKRTMFSTGEISNGMTLLAQSGLSTEESLMALDAVANLATGTLSTLQETSDLVTTTMRAFKIEAIEVNRVSDVMASAINGSKLTIDKLRIAFNYVGASAAQVGLELEETAASMMLLANSGLRASTTGTGLRQVLAKLVAPSRALREEFEHHGIALDQVNPSLVGYETALKNLAVVLYDAEKKTVDMSKAYDLFKLRGAQAAAIIIEGFTSGKYHEALESLYETGTAEEMAAKQSEGLMVSFKNMKDTAATAAVALGESGLTGILKVLVNSLQKFMQSMEWVAKNSFGSAIIQAVALATSIKLVASGFMYLTIALAKASPLLSSFLAALEMINAGNIALGLGRMQTAIAGVGAAFKLFISSVSGSLLIFSSLVVALFAIEKSHERAAEAAEKEAVKHKENVEVIKGYIDILKEVEEGSLRYISVMKRFQEEHPELAKRIKELTKEVDISTLSYEEFAMAMKTISHQEAIDNINKLAKALVNYQEKLDTISDNPITNWVRGWMPLISTFDEIKEKSTQTLDQVAIALAEMAVKAKAVSVKPFIEEIEELKGADEGVMAELIKRGDQAIKEMNLSLEKTKLFYESIFQNKPQAGGGAVVDSFLQPYRDMYNELSLLEQSKLSDVYVNTDKEISEYKRKASEIGHTAEQQAAAEMAIRANQMTEFLVSINKEKMTEEELAKFKIKVNQDMEAVSLKLLDNLHNRTMAIKKEELELAKGDDDAYGKIQAEITSIIEKYYKERLLIQKSFQKESITSNEEFAKLYAQAFSDKSDFFKQWLDEAIAQENENFDKRIATISENYDQEIAMFIAKEQYKITEAEQASEDIVTIIRGESGNIISAYNQRAEELKNSEVQHGNEIIDIVRDVNGKIISASNEKAEEIKKAEEGSLENVKSLYDNKFIDIENASKEHFSYLIDLTRGAAANELKALEEHYKNLQGVDSTKGQQRNEIKLKYVEKAKGIYEDEVKFWTGQLDLVKQKYQSLLDEAIDLKKQLFDSEKTYEQEIFELKIKTLSDYEQYEAKLTRFDETMAKADAEKQLAISATTFEEKKAYYLQEQEYIKDAHSLISDLSNKVTEGDREIISGEKAKQTAIDLTNKTRAATNESIKALDDINKQEQANEKKRYEDINKELKSTNDMLKTLSDLAQNITKEILVNVKIYGAEAATKLLDTLNKLKDKKTESQHTHTEITIQKIIKESRWGGLIEGARSGLRKLAFGGSLPGYGGGDIVNAKLEPGEFVHRKEAVRKYGANFMYRLNNLLIPTEMVNAIRAQLGGLITPKIQVPVMPSPFKLAMQAGGSVPALSGLQNMGSLNLSFDNAPVGVIYGEIDVLKRLGQQVKQQQRLRKNI